MRKMSLPSGLEVEILAETSICCVPDVVKVFTLFGYIQQVVVSDTVGFIQKLPPQLVAAFRSTLEHIESSTIILHVVDVSHPLAAAQSEAVCQVRRCSPPCIAQHL